MLQKRFEGLTINMIASIWGENICSGICPWTLYLFLEAHRFPQAMLSENCLLLGTDNVCGQLSIFSHQMEAIVYKAPKVLGTRCIVYSTCTLYFHLFEQYNHILSYLLGTNYTFTFGHTELNPLLLKSDL